MEDKTVYICDNCGHKEYKWTGRCPSCGTWNSFSETKVSKKQPVRLSDQGTAAAAPVPLASCATGEQVRIFSGIQEIDRVLGGGIMKGSAIMIGGEPGIGKSTLMLQLAESVSRQIKVLYISGEESAPQIKQRADRMGLSGKEMDILCETDLDAIMRVLNSGKYSFVILDSIQTAISREMGNTAGTVNQLKYTCTTLTDWAKLKDAVVIMIAHVTKDGNISGPKTIEHMVDTVLYFENSGTDLRIVRASKNRYGSIDEVAIFRMMEKGLEQIKNPETIFLTKRDGEIPPGISTAAVYEGTRVFLVELQALTVPAKAGVSRIFSDKIDSSVISRISAILEKRCRIKFSDQDIYVNVSGGIRIKDVGIELPIAMTLYSARTGIPVSGSVLSAGELSLTGEVLNVRNIEGRARTAADFGFKRLVSPAPVPKDTCIKFERIKVINDGIKAVFGKTTSAEPEDKEIQ